MREEYLSDTLDGPELAATITASARCLPLGEVATIVIGK